MCVYMYVYIYIYAYMTTHKQQVMEIYNLGCSSHDWISEFGKMRTELSALCWSGTSQIIKANLHRAFLTNS